MLLHGWRAREVGGRPIEVQRHDAQLCIGDPRKLIDGSAASGEVRHHLRRHLGRVG